MKKLALTLTLILSGCANSDKAEELATKWAETYREGWEITAGPNCDKTDSDGNGMVRCNMTLEKEGQIDNPAIECPSNWMPQWKDQCLISSGR